MTLLELLNTTTSYFQKRGIDSPRLNAEELLAHVLQCRRIDLYLQFERRINQTELDLLRPLVRRRSEHEPLQHILGRVDFFGFRFKCDQRALIPRPESELLVSEALNLAPNESGTLFDIGTGSGILALSFLKNKPGWRTIMNDTSNEALQLAHENAQLHQILERIEFVHGDFMALTQLSKADLLIANLPYLPSSILNQLSPELQFDPPNALDGGTDGANLIKRLIANAPQLLKTSGWLLLEIFEEHPALLIDEMGKIGFKNPAVLKDFNQRNRILKAQLI